MTDQPQSTGVAPVSLLSTAAATDLLPTPVLTTPTHTSLLVHTPHVDVIMPPQDIALFVCGDINSCSVCVY